MVRSSLSPKDFNKNIKPQSENCGFFYKGEVMRKDNNKYSKPLIYAALTSAELGILLTLFIGLAVLAFSFLFIGSADLFSEIFLSWIWIYLIVSSAVLFIFFSIKIHKNK